MPIQYSGVIQEHRCVRDAVGLFDVSHMGEIEIQGKDSCDFLQKLLTNDLSKMEDGSILYTLMCYDDGGVVDDLLVHRFNPNHYFLCVNASNTDKDFQWIQKQAGSFDLETRNTSSETAQLALQGKYAEELLQTVCDISLNEVRYYHFKKGKIQNNDSIISRTGYTGEDGFEIYLAPRKAPALFRALLDRGQSFGIQPIGLGARDTLRLEMGYALYGHEISEFTNPLEAGLGWVVKLGKGDFIGRQPLAEIKERGPKRKRVGFILKERGVPRQHYKVFKDGQVIGEVTSGTFSPSLNKGIGMCYVPPDHSAPGTLIEIKIRNQTVPAEVVKLPMVPGGVKP